MDVPHPHSRPGSGTRPRALWGLLLAAGVLLAACKPDAGPGTAASPTANPPREIEVWFLADRDGRLHLAKELRPVPDDERIAEAAVEQLLEGPTVEGLFSPFSAGTRVRSVAVEGGVATVDWTSDVLTVSVGAEGETYGIQSVVHTLVGLGGIDKVRFTVEGKQAGQASNGRRIEDWWGHVGLAGQPFTRDPGIRTLDASGQ